jgi:hypothetical protein
MKLTLLLAALAIAGCNHGQSASAQGVPDAGAVSARARDAGVQMLMFDAATRQSISDGGAPILVPPTGNRPGANPPAGNPIPH